MERTLILASMLSLSVSAAQAGHGGSELRCVSGALDTAAAPAKHPARAKELEVLVLTTDGRLACLNEEAPGKARVLSTVNGLQVDTSLEGIDFRVQDGALYGVGNAGGVYKIDQGSGVATLVNRLSVALEGSRFGVDFNPAADRLRVVSDTGQNLRHNLAGTTIADGPLNYTVGTTATGVVAAAYTNNDLSPAAAPTNAAATATTLFVIDAMLDQVVLQSPPNAGTLVATGKLQMDVGNWTGFDIYSVTHGGITLSNRALGTVAMADGRTSLVSVDVLTGKATARGALPAALAVADMAVPLNQRQD